MAGIQANDGVGWYLRGDGKIVAGTNRPDGSWLTREKLTYLGNAEYGPGGTVIAPLMKLAARHAADDEIGPLLAERLELAKANMANREQERINAKRQAEEDKLAAEAEIMGRAVGIGLQQAGIEVPKPKRKPGRPRKSSEPDPEPEIDDATE